MSARKSPAPLAYGNRAGIYTEHSLDNPPKHNAQAHRSLTEIYEASPINRQRSTKAEVECRRQALFEIVEAMKPMTVRQVFYQASVRDLIYHLGDFDPSGVSAREKIEQTLREMAPYRDITFGRLDVSPEQIEAWDFPTRPTNASDTRSKGFGEISVELDAIEPDELRNLVQIAIQEHLPQHQFEVLKAAEESERTIIRQLVGGLASAA
jgi:hypothetical protein